MVLDESFVRPEGKPAGTQHRQATRSRARAAHSSLASLAAARLQEERRFEASAPGHNQQSPEPTIEAARKSTRDAGRGLGINHGARRGLEAGSRRPKFSRCELLETRKSLHIVGGLAGDGSGSAVSSGAEQSSAEPSPSSCVVGWPAPCFWSCTIPSSSPTARDAQQPPDCAPGKGGIRAAHLTADRSSNVRHHPLGQGGKKDQVLPGRGVAGSSRRHRGLFANGEKRPNGGHEAPHKAKLFTDMGSMGKARQRWAAVAGTQCGGGTSPLEPPPR